MVSLFPPSLTSVRGPGLETKTERVTLKHMSISDILPQIYVMDAHPSFCHLLLLPMQKKVAFDRLLLLPMQQKPPFIQNANLITLEKGNFKSKLYNAITYSQHGTIRSVNVF